MRKTDFQFTGKKRLSLAEIIAEGGPMEERKAMEIARALCSRLMGEGGLTETDLSSFHPKTILLSSEGTISFSGEAVSESAKEPYLPPEYVKGSSSKETVVIYALGMLLLFLVTGREKKSGMDAMVKNPTLKTVINRCTALDSRRRYQSLTEVRSAINRELVFPRRRMKRLALAMILCLAAAASFYMFKNGRSAGEVEGTTVGFQDGYKNGYETAVSDAPGIGIEDKAFSGSYGNVSGNLNSEGGAFAVMGDDSVYFASGGRVYRMDPYSRETSLLAEHEALSSLSYWRGYLYYLTEDSLMRMDVGSGQEDVVSDWLWGRFCIYSGTLYLDDEKSTGFLYGIDTESLETRQLNAETALEYLNVTDGKLFYADPKKENHLFCCDHDGGNTRRLLSRACRDIALCGDRIYCLTPDDQHGGAPELLVSMDLSGGESEVLTRQPINRFAAEENGILYIQASSGYLEWMTPDGKTRYTICPFPVADFNAAGRWIFYRLPGDDALYRMRIDGSDNERLP